MRCTGTDHLPVTDSLSRAFSSRGSSGCKAKFGLWSFSLTSRQIVTDKFVPLLVGDGSPWVNGHASPGEDFPDLNEITLQVESMR